MIVSTICKLFFALAIGFFLNKKQILDAVTNKKLSYIVMQVALPCMIVSSVANTQGDKADVLKLLIMGFVVYACLPVISYLLVKCLHVSNNERGIYQVMFMFSNVVFMGYPVAATLFGSECIFYICIFHMPFNLLYFTYGNYLITKGSENIARLSIRQIFNNGIIASIISLVIYISNIQMPDTITVVLSFIGNIATPVSMIVIGATIGGYVLKEVFKEKKLFIVTLIRLIVFPILTYLIMSLAGFEGVMRGVATITLGMPIASVVSMTCTEYECNEKIASMSVVISTIFSIVTIPIMLILLKL